MNSHFRSLDFHRPEWTHRPLTRYYVKLTTGQVFFIWAYDATDAKDAVAGTVSEYGSGEPLGWRPSPDALPFEVREQWPHRVVGRFLTLADAQDFLRANGHRYALPIITSR